MIVKKKTGILIFFFLAIFLSCTDTKNKGGGTQATNAAQTDGVLNRNLFLKNLPAPTGYVNDYDNLFTDTEQTHLDSLIDAFEKATTIEIAIITLDSSACTKEDFDSLTLEIARKLGVGKKNANNGVLIGICHGYRRIRIQNGYGIEKILSDEETKQIIVNYFVPGFKQEGYYKGTYNGLTELMRILSARI
ncbi:MAG: TPM domain-containing protein [Chitinophagaceae bacterium]|nr:TPM domain-containing protein [Chitinophagaceae bacterium]